MQKKFSPQSPEYTSVNQLLYLMQKYWLTEDNQRYWDSLVDDVVKYADKQGEDTKLFAQMFGLCLIDYFEEKHRKGVK